MRTEARRSRRRSSRRSRSSLMVWGIVEDFDAADRPFETEGLPERREELLLRRRIGELARQRFARVAQSVFDKLALLAAARAPDGYPAAGLYAQSLGKDGGAFARQCDSTKGAAPAHDVEVGEKQESAPRPRAKYGRRAESRRDCPSSGTCGRKRLRCRIARPPRRWRKRRLRRCCAD